MEAHSIPAPESLEEPVVGSKITSCMGDSHTESAVGLITTLYAGTGVARCAKPAVGSKLTKPTVGSKLTRVWAFHTESAVGLITTLYVGTGVACCVRGLVSSDCLPRLSLTLPGSDPRVCANAFPPLPLRSNDQA
jgi:hypothetical protein